MKLIEMMVIGTMRPPGGCCNSLSARFMRHFNVINVDEVLRSTRCNIMLTT